MERPDWAPEIVDVDRPSGARMYDYFLGGSHNFPVDREAAKQVLAAMPQVPLRAQANRAFLRRAVRYLVDAGIRQFVDIGSGIPTVGNVHEIAQQVAPEARVMYVDVDPIAVAHSQELLAGNPRATVVQEDLRNPEAIMDRATEVLTIDHPIAVLMVAVLHFIPEEDEPHRAVATIRNRLAPGSYLGLTHADAGPLDEQQRAEGDQVYNRSDSPFYPRTNPEVARFFDGFDLVDPGLVWVPLWRPDSPSSIEDPAESIMLGGVGRLRD